MNNVAPIQLRSYTHERIAFETSSERPEVGTQLRRPSLNVDFEWESTPASDEEGLLRLTVSLGRESEGSPFQGEIVTLGRFVRLSDDDDVETDVFERYYLASGFSILYGLVRGLVVQLTAPEPYPPLVLPSFEFQASANSLVEQKYGSGEKEPEAE